jgi:hypothetical protein
MKRTHETSGNTTERPNLLLIGIKEEEVQAKGIDSIFNKILA